MHVRVKVSRKAFCRNPRGIFPNKALGEFCGDFLVDFFGLFSLENRKNSTQKSTAKISNQNLGVLQSKSTLQGSGLEKAHMHDRNTYASGCINRHICLHAFGLHCVPVCRGHVCIDCNREREREGEREGESEIDRERER